MLTSIPSSKKWVSWLVGAVSMFVLLVVFMPAGDPPSPPVFYTKTKAVKQPSTTNTKTTSDGPNASTIDPLMEEGIICGPRASCDCSVCAKILTALKLPAQIHAKISLYEDTCDCDACNRVSEAMLYASGIESASSTSGIPEIDEIIRAARMPPQQVKADTRAVTDVTQPSNCNAAKSASVNSNLHYGNISLDYGLRYAVDEHPAPRPYSTVRCIGGKAYRDQSGARICLLRDVCHVAGSAAAFTVYINPKEPPHPVYYDDNKLIPHADNNLAVRGTYQLGGVQRWEVETVEMERPAGYKFHPAAVAVAAHYQGGYNESMNFGTFIADGLHAAFAAQVALGIQPTTDTVLVDSPNGMAGPTPFKKFWEMARGMGTHEPIPEIRNAETVCFKELVIGFGPLSFMHLGELMSLTAEPFRTFLMGNLNVPMPSKITHQIVILAKSRSNVGSSASRGRHVENHEEVVKHITSIFQDKYGIPVRSVVPDDISIQAQMELAAASTVLVTPPGAGSFMAWFMPPGSSAVFLDVWGGLQGNWGQMQGEKSVRYALEDNVWGRLNYVSDIHYPVCAKTETLKSDHMDIADLLVVPERMAYMIWLALREAEERIPPEALPRVQLPKLMQQFRTNGSVCSINVGTQIFE